MRLWKIGESYDILRATHSMLIIWNELLDEFAMILDGVSCCIFSESEFQASSVGVQTAWYVIGVFVGAWDPETWLDLNWSRCRSQWIIWYHMDLDLTWSYTFHIQFISDLPSNSIVLGDERWAIFSMRSWWLRVLWVFGFAWRSFGWPCWPERSENAHGSSPVSLCRGRENLFESENFTELIDVKTILKTFFFLKKSKVQHSYHSYHSSGPSGPSTLWGLHKLEAVYGIDANREGQTWTWRSGAERVSVAPCGTMWHLRKGRNRFDIKKKTNTFSISFHIFPSWQANEAPFQSWANKKQAIRLDDQSWISKM